MENFYFPNFHFCIIFNSVFIWFSTFTNSIPVRYMLFIIKYVYESIMALSLRERCRCVVVKHPII